MTLLTTVCDKGGLFTYAVFIYTNITIVPAIHLA